MVGALERNVQPHYADLLLVHAGLQLGGVEEEAHRLGGEGDDGHDGALDGLERVALDPVGVGEDLREVCLQRALDDPPPLHDAGACERGLRLSRHDLGQAHDDVEVARGD
eukprot:757436-Hanusia_phi.AAC.7